MILRIFGFGMLKLVFFLILAYFRFFFASIRGGAIFVVIVGEESIYQQVNVSECNLLGIMGSSGKADFLSRIVDFVALTVHLLRSTNERRRCRQSCTPL